MSAKLPPPPADRIVQDARTLASFRKLGTPKRREDRCATCGREVTAREFGYAHPATQRVWCKRHIPVSS